MARAEAEGELNMEPRLNANSKWHVLCRLIAPGAIEVEAPLTVGLSL